MPDHQATQQKALVEGYPASERCEAITKSGMNHPAAQCKHRALPKQRFCKKHYELKQPTT